MPRISALNLSSESDSAENDKNTIPTLSVGLPVFNGGKWIGDAINSILEQSFTDFELIICDNASTDDTETICRNFVEQDNRVHYHRNPSNIGLHQNFDHVFELASGKYFKWAADSDLCMNGFFSKCVDVLENRPDVVLAYTRAFLLLFDTDGQEVALEYVDNFNLQDESPSLRFGKYLDREKINNIMHGVIRTSALKKTSLHRPMAGSDINMVAELTLLGKFVEVPDRLFIRRFDTETSSMMMNRETAKKRSVLLGRSFGQRVSLHIYRFSTVIKAPISWSEKIKIWVYLIRRLALVRYQIYRKIMQPFSRRQQI